MVFNLDEKDCLILSHLQQDARQSFAALGRQVGMSVPAVTERVRRLEDRGIIQGYRVTIDEAKLGRGQTVFIQAKVPSPQYTQFIQQCEQLDSVREAHHVTGDYAFFIKAVVADMLELEGLIGQLSRFGATHSTLVMSTRYVADTVPVQSE